MSDDNVYSMDYLKKWNPKTERDLLLAWGHEVERPMGSAKLLFQLLLVYTDPHESQRQEGYLKELLSALKHIKDAVAYVGDQLGQLAQTVDASSSLEESSMTDRLLPALHDRELLLIVCHDTYRPLQVANACIRDLMPLMGGDNVVAQKRLLDILGNELENLQEAIVLALRPVRQPMKW